MIIGKSPKRPNPLLIGMKISCTPINKNTKQDIYLKSSKQIVVEWISKCPGEELLYLLRQESLDKAIRELRIP